jgi:hypothetical protein
MNLVVLGPASSVTQAAAIFRDGVIIHVRDAKSLLDCVRGTSVDAVWVSAEGAVLAGLPHFRRLKDCCSVPIILGGEVSQSLAAAAVYLSEWSNPHVIMTGIDGEAAALRRFLSTCPPVSTRLELVARKRSDFALLPPAMELAVVNIVSEPLGDQTPRAFMRTLDYSPQHVARCLRNIGIRNLEAWLDAVRALHLWAYCRDPGFTMADIVSKIGRKSYQSADRLLKEFLESPTRKAACLLDESEALLRVEYKLQNWSA